MGESGSVEVKISRRAAERLREGHVWVYRSDLADPEQALPRAAVAHVVSERGRMLGSALSSSASQIALRMIAREAIQDGETLQKLWRERIQQAIAYRRRVVGDADSFRVLYSDADGVPGVVADKYNDVVVLQALTQAADRDDLKRIAVDELRRELSVENVVERVDAKMREREDLPAIESRLIAGEKSATGFHLNGLEFAFDAFAGQKIGAFLDQRENYAAAERCATGRGLDVCTYHGGFALHLARRCERVSAVDVSRAALEGADANGERNREQLRCEVEWMEADAFDLLRDWADAGERFDTIVVDPPAFAKTRKKAAEALRGYKELNLRALKMLNAGGVLVSCSCSQHVSEAEFLAMLQSAAADARRRLRVVEKRGQSADHPVLIGAPETQYLKCIVAEVV